MAKIYGSFLEGEDKHYWDNPKAFKKHALSKVRANKKGDAAELEALFKDYDSKDIDELLGYEDFDDFVSLDDNDITEFMGMSPDEFMTIITKAPYTFNAGADEEDDVEDTDTVDVDDDDTTDTEDTDTDDKAYVEDYEEGKDSELDDILEDKEDTLDPDDEEDDLGADDFGRSITSEYAMDDEDFDWYDDVSSKENRDYDFNEGHDFGLDDNTWSNLLNTSGDYSF